MIRKYIDRQGYKAFGHDLINSKLFIKMQLTIWALLFAAYFMTATISTRVFLGEEGFSQVRVYAVSLIAAPWIPNTNLSVVKNGKTVMATAVDFANSPTLKKWALGYLWRLFLAIMLPLPLFILAPRITRYYEQKEADRKKIKWLDGAKIVSPEEYKKEVDAAGKTSIPFGGFYTSLDTKKSADPDQLFSKVTAGESVDFVRLNANEFTPKEVFEGSVFHSIRLPLNIENAHIGLFGGTRSGKTVLMKQMLSEIRQRGDLAVILDQKGDFTESFYDPESDHILNFLDERCVQWNVWNDLTSGNSFLRKAELEALAAATIPESKGGDSEKFFNDAARDVLLGILDYLDRQGKHTNKDIWNLINSPTMEIAAALQSINARGGKHIQKDSNQSQGVHSVMLQYCKFFEYSQTLDGSFSITDWLDHGKGFIFLTNYDSVKDVLKPGLSMLLDLLGKKVLSRAEDLSGKRRLWIFLDELGSLHKLNTLVDILARAGSKGVCVVLSTQDRGQVENTYGRNLTDSIFNSCNSWAALRVTDPATARILVDRVGKTKFIEPEESYSDKFDDDGDSLNVSNRIKIENLLLDAHVMGQQPLEAYVHIDGFGYTHVKIEKRFFLAKNPAFIPRTDVNLAVDTDHHADPHGITQEDLAQLYEEEQEEDYQAELDEPTAKGKIETDEEILVMW